MSKTTTKLAKTNTSKSVTTPYVGVTAVNGGKHGWKARITLMGNRRYLGVFNTPEKAARAYNTEYKNFFGKKAYTVKKAK